MNKILIWYQTHQVLTNKNSLTEKPQNSKNTNVTQPNNTQENTNTRTKSISRKFKENYERGKDYLIIIKKLRMENSKEVNGKNESVLTYISPNNITELNELMYAGAKFVCEKLGIPLKSTKKKSIPGWEIGLGTQIKSTKIGRNDKTNERRWNMYRQKGKGNTRKK